MSPQAVIFDLFGTIVDGFAGAAAGYQERFATALGLTSERIAQPWRELTERRTLGDFQTVEASIEHLCRLLGANVTAAQIEAATRIRLELTRAALGPRSDAIATFEQLKALGFKIGLLSNCSVEIPIVWPETAFAEWFDATVFSAREKLKKPAPDLYRIACARLSVEAKDCIYVADGEKFELTAAAELGMRSILIKSSESHGDVKREAREWQGTTISSLAEIVAHTVR